VLFSGLTCDRPRRRRRLVGVNGAGKSTLAAPARGRARREGTVALSPPDATVGLLPQEPERRAGETVAAFLARRTGVAGPRSRWRGRGARAGASGDVSLPRRPLARLGGADLDERAGEVAAELGWRRAGPTDDRPSAAGRPGRPAALLLSRFDVLLLDEPTNDLDLDGLCSPGAVRAGPTQVPRSR
jgi:ATPase subunit of ABC transporter with duplicated ATPase domains